jgi:undecaprenyl-diphosphatase
VGQGLESLAADEVDDELLRRIWGQVALLRKARIAHRDLRLANVLVDEQGQPWIIDFGFAEAAASDRRLALDVTELLGSLATLVGADKAVGSAIDVLGQDTVTPALPLLQPLALSSATRHDLRAHPGLLAEVRQRVAAGTSAALPPTEPLTRIQPTTVLWLVGGAFAIHLLLPQVGELRNTMDAIRSVRWEWLIAGGIGAASLYFAAAFAMMGAVERPLAFGRTTLVQLAGSFMNRLAPKGLGGLGINERYLERAGVERPVAVASIALNMAAGLVVGVLTLAVVSALMGLRGVEQVHLPKNWPYLAVFLVVITLLGLGLFLRSSANRRKVIDPVIAAGRGLVRVLRSPWQAAQLFGGVSGVMVANVLTLAVCLQGFGGDASLLKVIAVYLGGSAIASASPTPGGLGAIEAALVAGLTAVGVQTGPAVAGVLTYRLLTFWLPVIPGFLALRYLQHRQIV